MFECGAFRFEFHFNKTKVDNIILQISTIKRVGQSYISICSSLCVVSKVKEHRSSEERVSQYVNGKY
jgi:hypothetical protein